MADTLDTLEMRLDLQAPDDDALQKAIEDQEALITMLEEECHRGAFTEAARFRLLYDALLESAKVTDIRFRIYGSVSDCLCAFSSKGDAVSHPVST